MVSAVGAGVDKRQLSTFKMDLFSSGKIKLGDAYTVLTTSFALTQGNLRIECVTDVVSNDHRLLTWLPLKKAPSSIGADHGSALRSLIYHPLCVPPLLVKL